jgi:transcription initiation factor TFIIB
MCENIGLPRTIAETAKTLYRRIEEEKLLRAKSQEAIIACCIFIACRQGNVSRSFREIYKLTNVPKKMIGQCFKVIEQAFALNAKDEEQVDGINGSGAEDLLVRYCNRLNLSASLQSTCRVVVQNANKHSIAQGRSPISIAAGAILFTCLLLGQSKSLKEIGEVAGVSEGTIKLVYRLYYQAKELIVNPQWITDGKADMSRLTPVDPPKGGSTLPTSFASSTGTPLGSTPTSSLAPTAYPSGTSTPHTLTRPTTPSPPT